MYWEAKHISSDKSIWILSSPENSVPLLCCCSSVNSEGASQVLVSISQQVISLSGASSNIIYKFQKDNSCLNLSFNVQLQLSLFNTEGNNHWPGCGSSLRSQLSISKTTSMLAAILHHSLIKVPLLWETSHTCYIILTVQRLFLFPSW